MLPVIRSDAPKEGQVVPKPRPIQRGAIARRECWTTRLNYAASTPDMIRKLKSGEYRLYSRKKDASTGKRRNLGTFQTMEKAKQHEREVQYFKKH
jgi:hypothetical protein